MLEVGFVTSIRSRLGGGLFRRRSKESPGSTTPPAPSITFAIKMEPSDGKDKDEDKDVDEDEAAKGKLVVSIEVVFEIFHPFVWKYVEFTCYCDESPMSHFSFRWLTYLY